jgi:4-alpha-glucanotransferase
LNQDGDGAFDRLAARFGVINSYRDYDGNEMAAPVKTKRMLLSAMGIHPATESEAASILASLEAADAEMRTAREHIVACRATSSIPLKGQCDWRLIDENGQEIGTGIASGKIDLPALESGVYQVSLTDGSGSENTTLIAAPPCAPSAKDITGSKRLWGVTAALYGLRSGRNSGIGNFSDLGEAAEALGRNGAQFLGINPVHALGIADRETISPYSPTSRAYYNIAHIAFEDIAELEGSVRLRRFLNENALELKKLREAELVDYAALLPIRDFVLKELYAIYAEIAPELGGNREFVEFVAASGDGLRTFGLYETLSETFGPDSRKWPAEYQSPDSREVRAFLRTHEKRIGFHCWLQWIADRQLAAAQSRAKASGMSIGLYLDVSVGSRPGGAESWANPSAVAVGVSLGAPPDAFSPQGQNWNLSPFSPEGLRRSRYQPFISMLRSAMRHAGMVRIDHVLGLSRSFWIPAAGEQGGYVRYPLEAMLAIVAIEAERNRTVVIGEDLGLVAPEFREKLQTGGLYGCAVMQFERHDGRFRDPVKWRETSMGSFGTHDTPTFRGFCQARDIEWSTRLSRGKKENPDQVKTERQSALRALFDATVPNVDGKDNGKGMSGDRMHAALADAGSDLVAVQLDDVLETIEQQNLPGTIDEHPNWRRRYPVPVENLGADERLVRVGRIMEKAGRSATAHTGTR